MERGLGKLNSGGDGGSVGGLLLMKRRWLAGEAAVDVPGFARRWGVVNG